ncbi:MAG TPA: hypothetical protein VN898_01845, partial [Candidatus Binatia bacterium]|nr:hypothetical protein [Candidatus Binatia bacterium]
MTRGGAREVAVQGLRKAALLTAALLLALVFGVRDAAAQAITFDSASNSVGLNVGSLTWSHTVGAGSGRIVVVGVSIRGNSTVTGVTYAGQALTVVGTVSNGGSNHVEMWALVAPPAGTANVVVSLSSSAHVVGGASSFLNVNQTTPYGPFASTTNNTSPITLAVTSAVGEVVIDTVVTNGDVVSLTPGAGQTERWNNFTGTNASNARGAGSTQPGAASLTMTWTMGSPKPYSIGAFSLKPVAAPVLTISKTDSPDPVAAGSNITYTISYGNTGGSQATGVVITDTIPANTSFVSATGGGTLAAGVVTWNIGTVNAGASSSVQLVVAVASPLNNGTVITNGTYDIDSAQTAPTSGAAVTTTVTSAPVMNISKTDAPDPVAAGSNITYTISYSNTGNMNATGVVITDTIPTNTSFVSATGGGTLAAGVVTWNIGNVAAGASSSVQLVVAVTSPLANGTVITNGTYSIDSTQTAPTSGAAVTTTVTSAPVVNISKTDSPDPVNAGSNITYTISYSNTGNMNATGVVITDTIPANTSFVSATGGGTLAAGVVTWNIGNLAAGASSSVQLVVAVASPLANGTVITNGTYSIDSTQTAPTSGAAVTTTVSSAPVMNISKTDAPDPVNAGSNITYTISYSNTGNMNATGVVITDT